MKARFELHEPDGIRVVELKGRQEWAMSQLLAAGSAGCTPITHPGPRWSDYVFKLRKLGIVVETITEDHGGPYAGHHARYVLRSRVARQGASASISQQNPAPTSSQAVAP